MNDNEKFIEEYVKGIPFEDAGVQHRDALKSQLLNAFGNQPRAAENQWATVIRTRVVKLAVAAVILLAMSLLIVQLTSMWSQSSIAWADVAQRFQLVPFFNASIYTKEDATSEPTQIELWWNHDGRMRFRMSTQVIFAKDGRVVGAYDVRARQPVKPDERAAAFLGRIAQADRFSLETVISIMCDGKAEDVTALINPDAVISQDVIVFDVDTPGMSRRVRIWALRESRLPGRIRVWDPANGATTDAVFEYSKGQPDRFFDADAFGTLLQSDSVKSGTSAIYAFLVDPHGREITLEKTAEKPDYHLPAIEQVGITPDGAVWIVSGKARNQMPNGRSFDGFAGIRDDLGRRYESVYGLHRAPDQSVQVFVPVDYPFDKRKPGKLSLVCQEPQLRPDSKPEVVGTVELTEWANDTLWPEGTVDEDEWSIRLRIATVLCRRSSFEKVERILATVDGRPEDNSAALERDRIRLQMLFAQQKYSDAATLAERLMPLLEADYVRWKRRAPDAQIFSDALGVLICAGRFDQANRTWERIKNLRPDLPADMSEQVRREIESMRKAYLDQC
jgi:hypothetical protein